MANIHTLRDLRSQTGPPHRATGGGSSAASSSSSSSGGSSSSSGSSGPRFATISSLRAEPPAPAPGAVPYSQYQYEPGKLGISMMQTRDLPMDAMPPMADRCYPNRTWRSITAAIMIIDTILFIITLIVAKVNYGSAFDSKNSMGGPGTPALFGMGADYYYAVRDEHEVWRLFTAIWLHAGFLHILFNMWMLSRFGFTLELRWTRWRFILIYVITGISASMWSCALNHDTVSVGASGALFGLVGADVAYLAYNFVEVPDGKQEACFLVFMIVINLLFGISSSDTHVDNYAHLGGLITGFPAAIWLCPTLVKREREMWYRAAGAFVFLGLFLLFALLIAK